MKFIHAKKIIDMKSFVYGCIHLCRWIKITLNFTFQFQSSKFKLYVHAQAILLKQLNTKKLKWFIMHV
jgi:hypothetical protein